MHEIPTFAVVGRVNMGKSAVIATLLEIDADEVIRISPTPGETTRCQSHAVAFGKREWLRFIDTPGFSRPVEAMHLIQQLHGPGTPDTATLRKFLALPGNDFSDEQRLLTPLLDGAGILYIVDPGRRLNDDFRAEMEILRWTGRPRLAVLNRHAPATGPDEAAWLTCLGATFNLVRTFDAHRARYGERLRLLRAIAEVDERWRATLGQVIQLIEAEWHERRAQAADLVLDFLQQALTLREQRTLSVRDAQLDERRRRVEADLARQYYQSLARLERDCFQRLLKIHRHHLLKPGIRDEPLQGLDLESAETWKKWGLSRAQLTLAGALTGGAAGAVIDLATGGISHGVFTVAGALGTGAAAWAKGGNLPDLRLDWRGGVTLATGEGRALTLGPPRNPNFPWILLDGVLLHYRAILGRAHGRRDVETLASPAPQDAGLTRDFPAERRATLAKWFASCLAGKLDPMLEIKALSELEAALAEVEGHTP
jgi:hypothetical protein